MPVKSEDAAAARDETAGQTPGCCCRRPSPAGASPGRAGRSAGAGSRRRGARRRRALRGDCQSGGVLHSKHGQAAAPTRTATAPAAPPPPRSSYCPNRIGLFDPCPSATIGSNQRGVHAVPCAACPAAPKREVSLARDQYAQGPPPRRTIRRSSELSCAANAQPEDDARCS